MQYFGREALDGMTLVAREPDRLLFSDPWGDLVVGVSAGRPNAVSVITAHWHGEAQEFLSRLAGADGTLHYQAETPHPPDEVLERARQYFGSGPEGLGLALSAEQPAALEFTGGGGQVIVSARADAARLVEVASRRWHYQAEQFVRQVAGER